MSCEGPFGAIEANGGWECKGHDKSGPQTFRLRLDEDHIAGISAAAGFWPVPAAERMSIRALALVSQRHHRLLAFAVIVVGLVVAAAHVQNMFRTDFRYARAGPGHVDHVAGAGLLLTEQAGIALNSRKTAALLAGADGIRGGYRQQH